MAELFVFTILATATAVYSALPRYRQLRIRYAIPSWYKLAAPLAGLGIVLFYLISVEIASSKPAFYYLCDISPFCFSIQVWLEATQIVLAILLVGLPLFWLFGTSPAIRRDEGLAQELRSLFSERNYETLVSVIDDNYNSLIRQESDIGSSESVATAERILLDNHFTEQYGQLNPQLGIRIIGDENAQIPRSDFAEAFLKGLHSETSSLLYHEIENNRNGETRRFRIPPENHLLTTLFDDCTVARDVMAWKGIGAGANDLLDHLYRVENDPYIHRNSQFSIHQHDESEFRDPLFAAIRFFDIMATESLYQGLEHHMWVGYYEGFTEKICRNYEIGVHGDPTAEFPNDYSYLLNEMIETLVKIVDRVAEDPDNVTTYLQSMDTEHEADIVKTAIRNLLMCHEHILLCDRIPPDFKRYVSDDVLELYLKLGETNIGECDRYFEVMRQHFLSEEIDNPIATSTRQEYLRYVSQHMEYYDMALLLTRPRASELFQELSTDLSSEIEY